MNLSITDYIILFAVFFIFAIIIYWALRGKLKGKKDIDYKPVEFKDIVLEKIKEKMQAFGVDGNNAILIVGNIVIGKVRGFVEFSGKEVEYTFDETRNIYLENKDFSEFEFIVFEIKKGRFSKSQYFLANKDKIKDLRYDPLSKVWQLPNFIDFYSYAGIWISEDISKEYLRKFALSFFDESVQTHLMNNPNRVVALDLEHAKRINLIKESIEAESRKYKNAKEGSESVIT